MTDAAATAPVDCAACGHVNPAGSKFCGQCGKSLAVQMSCAQCGVANPVGQSFCNGCGAALNSEESPAAQSAASSASPPPASRPVAIEGERKQVSVIFCDVIGSMELAERSDPEQWREVMDGLFQQLAEAVREYGGTVDKFTGDGLMALFGAPVAQEDHAERACHAALLMLERVSAFAENVRERHGIELAVRVGINSGEVVAGEIGGPETGDGYTAVGHTVGLAQRMESLAETGTAFLTQDTARLVEGHFDLIDLGPTEVKGSSEPLHVHRLVGVASDAEGAAARSTAGLSQLVGRDNELSQLTALLERAVKGSGGVVAIVGEPGVGKSRICRELVEISTGRGANVCQARCQSHTSSVPLMPTRQLMRSYFGIPLDATDAEARDTIRRAIGEIDPSLKDDLDVFFDFLAIPDPEVELKGISAEARRRRLFDLMRRIVRSRTEPVVSLIEDLHWIDPASEAVFEAYAEAIKGTPTLLVTNFRPEYEGRWLHRSGVHRIPLQPLEEDDVLGLLRELLGEDASLDGLAEKIFERTEGNPFFTEEMVRELAGSGVLSGSPGDYRLTKQFDDLPLPPSVQTVLSARIDRLTPHAKAVLGAASVAGNEFRFDLLQRIAGLETGELEAALDKLVDRDFIDQTEFYPDAAYMFRHPLTREVAYGTQLSAGKARAHAAAAEALQELHPDQLDEQASLIAQHYETAGETEKAIEWHARAAAWLGFNDANASYTLWQHVRDLSDKLPDCENADAVKLTSRMMLLMHGWRIGADESDTRRNFEEGLAVAQRTGNTIAQALLHGGMGVSAGMAYGQISEYARLGEEAARLAMTIDDRAARAAILTGPVHGRALVADYEGALEISDAIIEAADGDPLLGGGLTVGSPLTIGYSFRSLPLARLGRIAEARSDLATGMELGRDLDSEAYCWSLFFAFSLAGNGANVADDELLRMFDEASRLANSHGDRFSVRATIWWGGVVKSAIGDYSGAIEYFDEYAKFTLSPDREQITMDRASYAKALHAAGDLDAALADIDSGMRMAVTTGCDNVIPPLRSVEAAVLADRASNGDLERAERAIEDGEAYARRAKARLDLADLAISRARLLRARGEQEAYETALDAAESQAREIDAQGLLQMIGRMRGETLVAG